MTASFSARRCPRCGSALNTNGKQIWCTFVGGREEQSCAFGLDPEVRTLEEIDAEAARVRRLLQPTPVVPIDFAASANPPS